MHLRTKICRIKVRSVHTRKERCILHSTERQKVEIKRQTNFERLNCNVHIRFSFAFVQPGCEFIKFFFLLISRNVSFVHFEIFYANPRFKYIKKSLRMNVWKEHKCSTKVNNILSLAYLPAYAWIITLFLVFLFGESVCLSVRSASVCCVCVSAIIYPRSQFIWMKCCSQNCRAPT